jgi:hypothetical protein
MTKDVLKEIASIIYSFEIQVRDLDAVTEECVRSKMYGNANGYNMIATGVLTCKRLILERYEPKERSKILTEVDNIRKRVEGK